MNSKSCTCFFQLVIAGALRPVFGLPLLALPFQSHPHCYCLAMRRGCLMLVPHTALVSRLLTHLTATESMLPLWLFGSLCRATPTRNTNNVTMYVNLAEVRGSVFPFSVLRQCQQWCQPSSHCTGPPLRQSCWGKFVWLLCFLSLAK